MVKKISARFIIEIAGKPVENVERAFKLVLDKIKAEKNYSLEEELIESPEYDEETTLYAGFMEVLIKFKTTKDLVDFIFDYTPTSVEIEDPQKLEFSSNELTGVLNDFSIKILDLHKNIRKLNAYVHMLNEQNKVNKKE